MSAQLHVSFPSHSRQASIESMKSFTGLWNVPIQWLRERQKAQKPTASVGRVCQSAGAVVRVGRMERNPRKEIFCNPCSLDFRMHTTFEASKTVPFSGKNQLIHQRLKRKSRTSSHIKNALFILLDSFYSSVNTPKTIQRHLIVQYGKRTLK